MTARSESAPASTAARRRERDQAICESYANGASLRDIGDAHSLTPQRVQQILESHGIPRRVKGSSGARLLRAEVARLRTIERETATLTERLAKAEAALKEARPYVQRSLHRSWGAKTEKAFKAAESALQAIDAALHAAGGGE